MVIARIFEYFRFLKYGLPLNFILILGKNILFQIVKVNSIINISVRHNLF
jgi:hypothetical protein